MPKKLKELSAMSIGTRHRLVFEAMSKYGVATISDVLNYVCSNSNIDLTKANVKASLKKTIENDLKSLIGANNKLGVKYYLRDKETEVPIDQIEENQDGSVKNKYNIKYYIIGDGIQVPGLNLLSNSNVKVDLPKQMIMNLRVDPAYNVNESKQMHIVFQKNGNEFYSVNFKDEELPIGFVVCRNYKESTPFDLIKKDFGLRTFKITIDHASVDRYLPEIRAGHTYIKCNANNTIEIQDLNSLNGIYYSAVSKNMADLMFSKKITHPESKAKKAAKDTYAPRPLVTENLDLLSFDSYYPFHNENEWEKVNGKVCLDNSGYLIKVGSVIFYMGRSKIVVSGGSKTKAA